MIAGNVVRVVSTLTLIVGMSAALVANATGAPRQVAAAPMAAEPNSDSSATPGVSCVDVRTGTRFEFHARHLLGSGGIDSTWTPGAGQLCVGSLEGLQRNVLADGAGGAYVGWVDNQRSDPDIFLRRLTGTGEPVAGWPADGLPVCRAPYSQYQLDVAGDGSGGVFLAWQDYRSGRVGQVFVQHVTGLGAVAPGWPDGGKAVTDTIVEQAAPGLAPDGAGGIYIIWQGRHERRLGLIAQRLTSAGSPAPGWPGNGFSIAGGASEHRAPAIAADSLGRALVAWQAVDTLGARTLMALRLDRDASPEAGWRPTVLSLTDQAAELSEPALVLAAPAAMLVAWAESRGASMAIRAQRISLDEPAPVWQPGGVALCEGPVSLSAPVVLTDAQGGYVAWADLRGGSDSDIFVQRFTTAGSTSFGWPLNGVAVAGGAGNQYAPWLASDGAGGALVTWSDPALSASGGYVSLMNRFGQGIPRLVEALARSSQVRIVWQVASAFRESLEVERRLAGSDWQFHARLAPDDSGRVVLLDRTAPQGTHVDYRLGVVSGNSRLFFEPVGLDIPRAPLILTLHRARIDGARNAVVVAFSLPAGAAPTVELIDVAGRRVERQVLQGLDPGEHEANVRLPGRLPAGVYFVRLIQGGQARVAKAALLR